MFGHDEDVAPGFGGERDPGLRNRDLAAQMHVCTSVIARLGNAILAQKKRSAETCFCALPRP